MIQDKNLGTLHIPPTFETRANYEKAKLRWSKPINSKIFHHCKSIKFNLFSGILKNIQFILLFTLYMSATYIVCKNFNFQDFIITKLMTIFHFAPTKVPRLNLSWRSGGSSYQGPPSNLVGHAVSHCGLTISGSHLFAP